MAKEKEFKTISRCQYLNDRSLQKENVSHLPNTVTEILETRDFKDGKMVIKRELVTKKLSDRDKDFKWYDFSLESLQFRGMLNQATFSQLSDSSMSVADRIDVISAQIGESMNNNNNTNIE